MGNQLVGMAPTAIHPIEFYLSNVGDFEFRKSLGSTRFLKVAKCRNYEGDCVVKILAVEDPSLPLDKHKNEIKKLSSETMKNVSIAGFHRVSIQPTFALMARQYVRYSLYDRLSTRPFLSQLEKCWIAFQAFKCLDWCHSKGIVHGDLKLENILVTSSLWVVVTDFATYKPVYLPDDNPADFSYFFDTCRRRTCNIAPERFISDYSSQSNELLNQSSSSSSSSGLEPVVTPQMDMFSLGCVMAELFSDDAPNGHLFDLGNLLKYRSGEFVPDKLIHSISNEQIRRLIENLISIEPLKRFSASRVLRDHVPDLFPAYFESLYDYLKQLVRLPPDAKIIRLSQDIDQLLAPILEQEPQGLLLVLVVLTSAMRSLKHTHCKILSQQLACKMASASPVMSGYITDRLLPYLLHYLSDPDARVRASAIDSITRTLEQIDRIPQSDNNLFTDYILPVLCNISTDTSVLVRVTLALNVARLAKTAHNFLSQSSDQNYDEELHLLHDAFQMIVSRLLIDSSNCVRRSLLLDSRNCSSLCVFFGRQKTNDVILSHIITFLNDKSDYQLRMSFFDNIVVIASFLGNQCSQILQPLLQQGLADPEESIVYKAVEAISSLVQQGLLPKNITYELVREAMPLLAHPNLWIQHAMVEMVLTLSSRMSIADINCKIKPLVDNHLHQKIHSLSNGPLLLDSLFDPVPRSIYDLVVHSKHGCDPLIECLNQRCAVRMFSKHQTRSSTIIDDALYTRLVPEGINDQIEEQLLHLADLLKKVNSARKNQQQKKVTGTIVVHKNSKRRCFEVTLFENNGQDKKKQQATSAQMNDEWLHMFGSTNKLIATTADDDSSSVIPVAHEAKEHDDNEMSIHVRCPPCHTEVNKLIMHKKTNFRPPSPPRTTPTSPLRPRGVLVAHLQEHSASVNRVIAIDDTLLFATCSADGTIKVWDAAKMEESSTPWINRSKQTYISQSIPNAQEFLGIAYCNGCIVGFTDTNMIHVLELDGQTSKMKLACVFEIAFDISNSRITDILTLSSNVFGVACSDSTVLGYDLRQLIASGDPASVQPIWKLKIQAHERLLNCIAGDDIVLFAGTTRGKIFTFDLRFLIQANTMSYPNQIRVRRMLWSPTVGLFSAAQGNSEVSLWDCEAGQRKLTLWASSAPALSQTQSSSHSVLGMLLSPHKDKSSMVTCGTDMKIRYWDLAHPERSRIVSENSKLGSGAAGAGNSVKYTSKFIEGIEVIQEYKQDAGQHLPGASAQASNSHHKDQHLSWDQLLVSPAHRDCVTDLARVGHLLVSTGRDGVVKIWK